MLYGFGEVYAKVAGQPFRMQGRCWMNGNEWHIEGEAPGFPPVNLTWVRVSRRADGEDAEDARR